MSRFLLLALACVLLLAAPSSATPPGSTFSFVSNEGNAIYRAPDGSLWMGPPAPPKAASVFVPQFGLAAPAASGGCPGGVCPVPQKKFIR